MGDEGLDPPPLGTRLTAALCSIVRLADADAEAEAEEEEKSNGSDAVTLKPDNTSSEINSHWNNGSTDSRC